MSAPPHTHTSIQTKKEASAGFPVSSLNQNNAAKALFPITIPNKAIIADRDWIRDQ